MPFNIFYIKGAATVDLFWFIKIEAPFVGARLFFFRPLLPNPSPSLHIFLWADFAKYFVSRIRSGVQNSKRRSIMNLYRLRPLNSYGTISL